MTVKEWMQHANHTLVEAEINSARLDTLLMLEHVLEKERSSLLAHDDDDLTKDQHNSLEALLEQRSLRVPLAYLLGAREFYGLNFKVSPGVLIPRPETEVLVEYAIRYAIKDASVVELGTGSGCIAVSLSKHRPDVSIVATDVSFEALEVAQENNRANAAQVQFHHSDLFESIRGTYDVILANLPYVPLLARRQPEITYEPDVSLYGGDDGLDLYRTFFKKLPLHATDQTLCLVEFSPTQYLAVREFCEPLGLDTQPLSEYIYRVHVVKK